MSDCAIREQLLLASIHAEDPDELRDALDLARKEIDRLEAEVLARAVLLWCIEWNGTDLPPSVQNGRNCPVCQNKPHEGHTDKCELNLLAYPLTVPK